MATRLLGLAFALLVSGGLHSQRPAVAGIAGEWILGIERFGDIRYRTGANVPLSGRGNV